MTMSGHTIALDEEARISARRIFSIVANELMQVELEEMGRITSENFDRFFGL